MDIKITGMRDPGGDHIRAAVEREEREKYEYLARIQKTRDDLTARIHGNLTNKPQSLQKLVGLERGDADWSLALSVQWSMLRVSHPKRMKNSGFAVNHRGAIVVGFIAWPADYVPAYTSVHFDTPLDGDEHYMEEPDLCPACGEDVNNGDGHGECDDCGYTWTFDEEEDEE